MIHFSRTKSVVALGILLLLSVSSFTAFASTGPISNAQTKSGSAASISSSARYNPIGSTASKSVYSCPSPVTNESSVTIPLTYSTNPNGIAFDPSHSLVWVAAQDGTVQAISTLTNKVNSTISVDDDLGGIAVDTSNSQIFVASKTQNVVYTLRPVEKGISLPKDSVPTYILYDPVYNKIYVSDTGSGYISVIDPATYKVIKNIKLSADYNAMPYGLAYDSFNGLVFATDTQGSRIDVINNDNAIVASLSLGTVGPFGVAFDPFNSRLYITGNYVGKLLVYNATGDDPSLFNPLYNITFASGSEPFGVDVDCSTGNIWVSDTGLNAVYVLSACSSNIINTTSNLSAPEWFSFDSVHHQMYVTEQGGMAVVMLPSDAVPPQTVNDCAIGLADYGMYKGVSYTYTTTKFQSNTTFTSLNIGNNANPAVNNIMSVQFNMVDYGVTEHSNTGAYWVQNIADMKQTGNYYGIAVINNIWNWTVNGGSMSNAPGDLNHTCASGTFGNSNGQLYYYCQIGDVTKNSFVANVSLPFTIQLEVDTYASTHGNSTIAFYYSIYQGNTKVNGSEYDIVTFSGSGGSPAFKVGGYSTQKYYGNTFIPNDVENVFSGYPSGSGYSCAGCVIVNKIDASMQVYYLPKAGKQFTLLTHAYSAGSETAEMVVNVHMVENGKTHSAMAVSGTDNDVELW